MKGKGIDRPRLSVRSEWSGKADSNPCVSCTLDYPWCFDRIGTDQQVYNYLVGVEMELIIFGLVILLLIAVVVAWAFKEDNNYLRRENQRLIALVDQYYEDDMTVRAAEAIANGTYPDPYSRFRPDPAEDEHISPS